MTHPIAEGDSIWREAFNALTSLFKRQHKELIRLIRIPTPQKVTFNVTADGTGTIGGGFSNPNPVFIYQCPMSSEAWIHRISISSPSYFPKTPLTTGQLFFVGGSGELIFFLPVSGNIAPLVMAEGYASAAHLNAGSRISVYGDSFPANVSLRLDLQISLVQGVSEYTPLDHWSEREKIYQ